MMNPPHPGRSIRENCLDPLGLSVTEAAKVVGVARHTLSRVLNGHAAISVEMAIRLEKVDWSYRRVLAAPADRLRSGAGAQGRGPDRGQALSVASAGARHDDRHAGERPRLGRPACANRTCHSPRSAYGRPIQSSGGSATAIAQTRHPASPGGRRRLRRHDWWRPRPQAFPNRLSISHTQTRCALG